MTVKELQEYINNRKLITYNGIKYKAIGYQLLVKDNEKVKSAILQDIRQEKNMLYVEVDKIKE